MNWLWSSQATSHPHAYQGHSHLLTLLKQEDARNNPLGCKICCASHTGVLKQDPQVIVATDENEFSQQYAAQFPDPPDKDISNLDGMPCSPTSPPRPRLHRSWSNSLASPEDAEVHKLDFQVGVEAQLESNKRKSFRRGQDQDCEEALAGYWPDHAKDPEPELSPVSDHRPDGSDELPDFDGSFVPILVRMSIENVLFRKLDLQVRNDLKLRIQSTIARNVGVSNRRVFVKLFSGSIKVIVRVEVPPAKAESIDSSLVSQDVLETAKSIEGVRKAAVGPIELNIDEPTIHNEDWIQDEGVAPKIGYGRGSGGENSMSRSDFSSPSPSPRRSSRSPSPAPSPSPSPGSGWTRMDSNASQNSVHSSSWTRMNSNDSQNDPVSPHTARSSSIFDFFGMGSQEVDQSPLKADQTQMKPTNKKKDMIAAFMSEAREGISCSLLTKRLSSADAQSDEGSKLGMDIKLTLDKSRENVILAPMNDESALPWKVPLSKAEVYGFYDNTQNVGLDHPTLMIQSMEHRSRCILMKIIDSEGPSYRQFSLLFAIVNKDIETHSKMLQSLQILAVHAKRTPGTQLPEGIPELDGVEPEPTPLEPSPLAEFTEVENTHLRCDCDRDCDCVSLSEDSRGETGKLVSL